MESYCSALLSQEKSLEELQRHLRTTEELFRESVKRKNQQLDLLQSEVRRLKTSVAGRDEQASTQIESALGAQSAELRRLKELVATRDADVAHLTKQLESVKLELNKEKSKREHVDLVAQSSSAAESELRKREEELQGVRAQLAQAQSAASRLQAASSEAEAALQAREAELAELRKREQPASTTAEQQMLSKEVKLLRAKCDDLESKLAKEEVARSEAESWASDLENQRDDLQREREQLKADLEEMQNALTASEDSRSKLEEASRSDSSFKRKASSPRLSTETSRTEPMESRLEHETNEQHERAAVALTQERAAIAPTRGVEPDHVKPQSRAPVEPINPASSYKPAEVTSRRSSADERPGAAAPEEETEPAVRSLVVGGNAVMGDTLYAEASFVCADFTSSTFAWYRGSEKLPASGPSYMTTAEDVGIEILVVVTPVSRDGRQGKPEQAHSSEPIAVAADIHMRVGDWVNIGQRRFDGCMEGDKERVLQLDSTKLKVRDRSGKTLVKDAYASIRMELAPDPLGFSLFMPSKKGGGPLHLRTSTSMWRNLIALTISAFRDHLSLSSWPLATSNAPSIVLDLATLGAQTATGNPDSPASSFTSEQPSMADVQDHNDRASIARKGRAFSFGRSKKK